MSDPLIIEVHPWDKKYFCVGTQSWEAPRCIYHLSWRHELRGPIYAVKVGPVWKATCGYGVLEAAAINRALIHWIDVAPDATAFALAKTIHIALKAGASANSIAESLNISGLRVQNLAAAGKKGKYDMMYVPDRRSA